MDSASAPAYSLPDQPDYWTRAVHSLLRCGRLSPHLRLTYLILQSHAGPSGQVTLDEPTLAGEVGVSLRTVRTDLHQLAALGLLTIEAGRGAANRYTLQAIPLRTRSDAAEAAPTPATVAAPSLPPATVAVLPRVTLPTPARATALPRQESAAVPAMVAGPPAAVAALDARPSGSERQIGSDHPDHDSDPPPPAPAPVTTVASGRHSTADADRRTDGGRPDAPTREAAPAGSLPARVVADTRRIVHRLHLPESDARRLAQLAAARGQPRRYIADLLDYVCDTPSVQNPVGCLIRLVEAGASRPPPARRHARTPAAPPPIPPGRAPLDPEKYLHGKYAYLFNPGGGTAGAEEQAS